MPAVVVGAFSVHVPCCRWACQGQLLSIRYGSCHLNSLNYSLRGLNWNIEMYCSLTLPHIDSSRIAGHLPSAVCHLDQCAKVEFGASKSAVYHLDPHRLLCFIVHHCSSDGLYLSF